MEAWPLVAMRAPDQGRILPPLPNPRTNNPSVLFLLLYLPKPVVVSWKDTLFVGIDACFKTKLKDRGLKDPDLATGLAYMVNENQYQEYLAANPDVNEPVSCVLYPSFIDSLLIAVIADHNLWSRPQRCKPGIYKALSGIYRHWRCRCFVPPRLCPSKWGC